MSLISLLPSFSILLVVAGIAPLFNIQIDEYTIIFVGISMGLTIDYTIHMLNAIRKTKLKPADDSSFVSGRRALLTYGYSLVRSGGVPVFLSFVTSIMAFSTLYFSSFSGAVHFAFLLSVAMVAAFFISVFLLPLFFIPKGGDDAL